MTQEAQCTHFDPTDVLACCHLVLMTKGGANSGWASPHDAHCWRSHAVEGGVAELASRVGWEHSEGVAHLTHGFFSPSPVNRDLHHRSVELSTVIATPSLSTDVTVTSVQCTSILCRCLSVHMIVNKAGAESEMQTPSGT